MIIAGIDVGAVTTKAVIVNDGKIIGSGVTRTGFEQKEAVDEALAEAINKAGISRNDIERVGATGAGSEVVDFADASLTDVESSALGAHALFPQAKTVIDVGGEESRGIKVNQEGRVKDFALNEKCAAGAGTAVETLSRALEVKTEEMSDLASKSTKDLEINAQCVIFMESEVVSLIHAKEAKADIAKAIHDGIVTRIVSMVKRVGIEKEVALVGGTIYNKNLVELMKEHLGTDVLIPEDPQIVGALGAAIYAAS